MQAVASIVEATVRRSASQACETALLVGISGIDGSGKGYLSGQVGTTLEAHGLNTAVINIDGWLNLPSIRFDSTRPAECFYENALRLDDLFAQLVLPLKRRRSAHVTMDYVEETATTTRPHRYDYENLDIIVLEGIYLFKRAYRSLFDLAVWVDCSMETALERALARAQEGLPPDETVQAYNTIYFPAQEIHFARDNPRGSADLIVSNDPRLGVE